MLCTTPAPHPSFSAPQPENSIKCKYFIPSLLWLKITHLFPTALGRNFKFLPMAHKVVHHQTLLLHRPTLFHNHYAPATGPSTPCRPRIHQACSYLRAFRLTAPLVRNTSLSDPHTFDSFFPPSLCRNATSPDKSFPTNQFKMVLLILPTPTPSSLHLIILPHTSQLEYTYER